MQQTFLLDFSKLFDGYNKTDLSVYTREYLRELKVGKSRLIEREVRFLCFPQAGHTLTLVVQHLCVHEILPGATTEKAYS